MTTTSTSLLRRGTLKDHRAAGLPLKDGDRVMIAGTSAQHTDFAPIEATIHLGQSGVSFRDADGQPVVSGGYATKFWLAPAGGPANPAAPTAARRPGGARKPKALTTVEAGVLRKAIELGTITAADVLVFTPAPRLAAAGYLADNGDGSFTVTAAGRVRLAGK